MKLFPTPCLCFFFLKFLGDFRTIFELCTLCWYVCVCAGNFLCGLGLWPHWIIQISCEELYCSRCLYIPGTFLSCTHCLHILIWLNLSCVHILFGCRLLCICTGPLALAVFSTCLPKLVFSSAQHWHVLFSEIFCNRQTHVFVQVWVWFSWSNKFDKSIRLLRRRYFNFYLWNTVAGIRGFPVLKPLSAIHTHKNISLSHVFIVWTQQGYSEIQ